MSSILLPFNCLERKWAAVKKKERESGLMFKIISVRTKPKHYVEQKPKVKRSTSPRAQLEHDNIIKW